MADKSGKKEKVSELDKNFQKTLQEIASNEKDFKTECFFRVWLLTF